MTSHSSSGDQAPVEPPRSPREQFLQSVIDLAGCVVLVLDLDHRIVEWNVAAEELYQTPKAKALGLDYLETFIAAEHRGPVAEDIQRVLAGTPTRGFEDDSILPDGTRRTLVWNVTRVLDAEGLPVGIVAVGQDITERKAAEEKFRLVFEHTSEGLLLGDVGGVIDCNPAALAMLGLTDKSELVKHHPADFSPPLQPDGRPSREKAREMDQRTKEEGFLRFDWVHRRPDGVDVPVEITVRRAPFRDRVISVVAWHDLTERRSMEVRQVELQAQLAQMQKMEAVGQLAGGIAHDFNNLLTAIRGSIELASMEVAADSTIGVELEMMLGAVNRASALTRQLLVFSRQRPPSREPVVLRDVVLGAESLLRRALPPTITLSLNLADDRAAVVADRGQLEQVLLNLVLNARDAMPKGGTIGIELYPLPLERVVRLSVHDSGAGMNAETLAHIFEPFFTTKPMGQGTGLGLAIVYGIVTQAGGSVRAISSPDHGSTFIVELPIATSRGAATGPSATNPDGWPRGNELVLLAEDEAAVRRATSRLLERFGYRVIEAENGLDAITKWQAQRDAISAVITDVRMPQMGGPELAEALRRESPALPILLVSGYERLDDAMAPHAIDIPMLEKPFAVGTLLTHLRDLIDASAMKP